MATNTLTDADSVSRRLIAQMLAEGSSGAPIQHWTQGLNRLANGIFGGLNLSALKAEEKAKDAEIARLLGSAPGLGGSMPPMGQPSPVAAALSPQGPVPQAQPVQMASLGSQPNTASDVTTVEPQQTRGVIQGNLSDEPVVSMSVENQPMRVAQALMPGAQRQPMNIPPGMQSYIKGLLANKNTRAQGLALYGQYAKPNTWQKLDDSTLFDPSSGRTMPAGQGYHPLVNPADRARFGIPEEDKRPYQVGPNGKLINPPAETRVTVDQRGESEFSKVAASQQAKRFDELAADGPAAKQMVSDLQTLRTLGTQIGTGKEAQIKASLGPYAEMLGVKIDGLGEIQAYEAIVNRLAPNLRVKGSGAQSDFELRNFLKSLPSLGNTPDGNEIATKVMEGLYNNKMAAAEIGSKALTGEISRADAEKALRSLPDPMKEWREFNKKSPAQPKPSGTPTLQDIEQEIRRRQRQL